MHTAADNAMPILNLLENDYYYKESKRKEVCNYLPTAPFTVLRSNRICIRLLTYEMKRIHACRTDKNIGIPI